MQAAGLIERQPDPDDARATFASITPEGRALVRKTRRRHHPFLQQIFGEALNDRDLADLIRIMNKLDTQPLR
jgi:DNA-binding MarR family transcriptional regulator